MIGQAITFVNGIIFGLSLAASPGAMNAIIAEQSVLGGWGTGFKAGLGAMTADLCFLVLTFFGLTAIVNKSIIIHGSLLGVGGLLMIYFAIDAVKNANMVLLKDDESEVSEKGFTKAFALAITNPYQIIWWLTIGIALLEPGEIEVIGYSIETGSYLILVGLFSGVLMWIISFPMMLKLAKDKINRLEYIIAYLSAVVLAGFAVIFLYNSAMELFF